MIEANGQGTYLTSTFLRPLPPSATLNPLQLGTDSLQQLYYYFLAL